MLKYREKTLNVLTCSLNKFRMASELIKCLLIIHFSDKKEERRLKSVEKAKQHKHHKEHMNEHKREKMERRQLRAERRKKEQNRRLGAVQRKLVHQYIRLNYQLKLDKKRNSFLQDRIYKVLVRKGIEVIGENEDELKATELDQDDNDRRKNAVKKSSETKSLKQTSNKQSKS